MKSAVKIVITVAMLFTQTIQATQSLDKFPIGCIEALKIMHGFFHKAYEWEREESHKQQATVYQYWIDVMENPALYDSEQNEKARSICYSLQPYDAEGLEELRQEVDQYFLFVKHSTKKGEEIDYSSEIDKLQYYIKQIKDDVERQLNPLKEQARKISVRASCQIKGIERMIEDLQELPKSKEESQRNDAKRIAVLVRSLGKKGVLEYIPYCP